MRIQINILALGSPHGDDRVGWDVAETLRPDLHVNGTVEVLSTPWDLLHHLAEDRPTIIVDAIRAHRIPGEVYQVAASELTDLSGRSSHSVPLCDILALAEVRRQLPAQFVVIGVEIETLSPGDEMSSAVRNAIPVACGHICDLISEWTRDNDA